MQAAHDAGGSRDPRDRREQGRGRSYEKAKARVGFEDLVTVPDLGKEAFYDDRPFSGVHVLVADDLLLSTGVQNYSTAKADLPKPPEELSIDATRIVVRRLKK